MLINYRKGESINLMSIENYTIEGDSKFVNLLCLNLSSPVCAGVKDGQKHIYTAPFLQILCEEYQDFMIVLDKDSIGTETFDSDITFEVSGSNNYAFDVDAPPICTTLPSRRLVFQTYSGQCKFKYILYRRTIRRRRYL